MADKNRSGRETIIKAGRELFRKHGVKRISIGEICKTASISRVTFYKHFNDKDDLLLCIAKIFSQKFFAKMTGIISDKHLPFEEKAARVNALKSAGIKELGEEFVKDIAGNKTPLAAKYSRQMRIKRLQLAKRLFVTARRNGEIRSDLPVEFMLYMLNKVNDIYCEIQGDKTLRKSFSGSMDIVKKLFLIYCRGIISRPKKKGRKTRRR